MLDGLNMFYDHCDLLSKDWAVKCSPAAEGRPQSVNSAGSEHR